MKNEELVQAFNDYGCLCQKNKKYLAAKLAYKQALTFEPDNFGCLG